jgi:hypothetical protein
MDRRYEEKEHEAGGNERAVNRLDTFIVDILVSTTSR